MNLENNAPFLIPAVSPEGKLVKIEDKQVDLAALKGYKILDDDFLTFDKKPFKTFVRDFETRGQKDPYTAVNPNTGAYGAFQLIKSHRGPQVEKMFGMPFEEALKKPENQDKFFEEVLVPEYYSSAKKMKGMQSVKDKKLDQFALMALMQLGPTNIYRYLKDEKNFSKKRPEVVKQINYILDNYNRFKQQSQQAENEITPLNRRPTSVEEPQPLETDGLETSTPQESEFVGSVVDTQEPESTPEETVESEVTPEEPEALEAVKVEQPKTTKPLIPVFSNQGELFNIEEDQVDLAKKEGFILKSDIDALPKMVDMVDPSGKKYRIEKEQVPLALKEKFKLSTEIKPAEVEPKKELDTTIKDTAIGLKDFTFDTFKSLAQTGGDALRMAGAGATLNFSDELVGALSAVAAAPFSDENIYVLYDKYKKAEEERIKQAEERSPIIGGGAKMIGAAIPAALITAATKGRLVPTSQIKSISDVFSKKGLEYATKGAAIGAIEGGIGAVGEADEDLLKAGVEGATGGALAGGILSPAFGYAGGKLPAMKDKINSVIDNTKRLRLLKTAFTSKAKLVPLDFETDKGLAALQERQKDFAKSIAAQIAGVDETLGSRMSRLIEAASGKNIKIDFSKEETDQLLKLLKLVQTNKLEFDSLAKPLYNFNFSKKGPVDPIVIRDLQQAVTRRRSQLTPGDPSGRQELLQKADDILKEALKRGVPGFKKASDDFTNFRNYTIEHLINEGRDIRLNVKSIDDKKIIERGKRLGRYATGQREYARDDTLAEMVDVLDYHISGMGKIGHSSEKSTSLINNLVKNLELFELETGENLVDLGKFTVKKAKDRIVKGGLGVDPKSSISASDVIIEKIAKDAARLGKKLEDLSEEELDSLAKKYVDSATEKAANKAVSGIDELDVQAADDSIFDLLEPNKLRKRFREEADIAGVRQKAQGEDQGYGTPTPGAKGVAQLLGGVAYAGSRAAGSIYGAAKTAVKGIKSNEMIRMFVNASDNTLLKSADMIEPKFPNQAKALRTAIQEKNEIRKNAVIFALSQNPKFKDFLPSLLESQESEQEMPNE